jgi:hypothetical protein
MVHWITKRAFGDTCVYGQVPALQQVVLTIMQCTKWDVTQCTVQRQHYGLGASLF